MSDPPQRHGRFLPQMPGYLQLFEIQDPPASGIIVFESSRGKVYRLAMKVAIHLSRDEEAKALPILLRHSPGMVLAHQTYVLSEDAIKCLRKAGIRFSEISREASAPGLEEVAGERV